jgi:CelD/BcsL family acetyltransferase involved in cellulose biosynthesis
MTPLTVKFEDMSRIPAATDRKKSRNSALFGVPDNRPQVLVSIHEEIEPLKAVWQALEKTGDCTAFQTFAWISAWQRHIGTKQGVKPAIVVGWDSEGGALFILPLGIENGILCHKLTWLGGDLGDYNAAAFARLLALRLAGAVPRALGRYSRDAPHPSHRDA